MQRLAPAAQQGAVGRVAHQRVFEQEGGLRRHAPAEHEARIAEPIEGRPQVGLALLATGASNS
jgi:hypothetical protein